MHLKCYFLRLIVCLYISVVLAGLCVAVAVAYIGFSIYCFFRRRARARAIPLRPTVEPATAEWIQMIPLPYRLAAVPEQSDEEEAEQDSNADEDSFESIALSSMEQDESEGTFYGQEEQVLETFL